MIVVLAGGLLLTSLPAHLSAPIPPASFGAASAPRSAGVGPALAPPVPGVPSAASPTWINITATGAGNVPPPIDSASIAYDPVDHVTLLFGGSIAGIPSNQTWTFTNGTWTNLTRPADAPPARTYAGMDYDANMHGFLLFGGEGPSALLNDTWLFQDGLWTNLTYIGGAPPPRFGEALAFDPAPEENGSVLFGGCDGVARFLVYECLNDTWVWQGWSGWSRIAASSPPNARGWPAMAYDAVSGALVMFGGCYGLECHTFDNETWELADGQWSTISTPVHPSGRSGPAMASDPATGQLLLFGGVDQAGGDDNDTWSFSHGAWTELDPSAAPSPRSGAALALDPAGTAFLLFGGLSGSAVNDTWVYEIAPTATVAAAIPTTEVGAATAFTVTVAGGSSPFSGELNFGDGSSEAVSGAGPTYSLSHVFSTTGTFTPTLSVTDSVGRTASATGSAVTVSAGPSLLLGPEPTAGDVGAPLAFAASNGSGGVAPFTYTWQFGDGATGSGPGPSHAFAAPGVFPVTVSETDADGAVVNASFSVAIAADPTVQLVPLLASATPGEAASFGALVTGGTGPLTYSWRFGDGSTSSSAAPVHAFAKPRTYTVEVWANDSDGESAHASVQFNVSTAPSSASTGAPVWFWPGIGGLVAVGGVGTFTLRHFRRTPRTPA